MDEPTRNPEEPLDWQRRLGRLPGYPYRGMGTATLQKGGPPNIGDPWILTHDGPLVLRIESGQLLVSLQQLASGALICRINPEHNIGPDDSCPDDDLLPDAPWNEPLALSAGTALRISGEAVLHLVNPDDNDAAIAIHDNYEAKGVPGGLGRCGGGCWGTGGLLSDAFADQ